MDENEKVIVIDELGQEREANIINIIEIDNQEYLLYTIDENSEEESIYAMKIIKNENGEEDLIQITDIEEKNMVREVISKVIDNLD